MTLSIIDKCKNYRSIGIVTDTSSMRQYCMCNELVNSEVLIISFHNFCFKMDLNEMSLKLFNRQILLPIN